MRGRSALIVATQTYADAKLKALRAPAQDAEALAQVLGDETIGDFDVSLSFDEPEWAVRRKVEQFFQNRQRDDLLLLHFSCHGIKDDDGRLYFAASDTISESLDSTAVSAEFVQRQMTRSRSRRIVLLLDCCYSGAFTRGSLTRSGSAVDVGERFEGTGRAVITASSELEYAFEGEQVSGEATPSVFTEALVRGLRTGEADLDGDGEISIDELYNHIFDEVRRREPRQTPKRWSEIEGQLFIAKSVRPVVVAPAELPRELLDLLGHPVAAARMGGMNDLMERYGASPDPRVTLALRLAFEQCLDDDSKRVSELAASHLAKLPEPVAVPVPDPVPAPDPDPVPEPDPIPEPDPHPIPEPDPDPVPEPPPAIDTHPSHGRAVSLLLAGFVLHLLAAGIGSTRSEFPGGTWLLYETIMAPLLAASALVAATRVRYRGLALGIGLALTIETTSGYAMALGIQSGGEIVRSTVVVFLGAVLMLAGALGLLRAIPPSAESARQVTGRGRRTAAALGMLAAAAMIVCVLFLNFRDGPTIYQENHWYLLEPLVGAIGVAVAALGLRFGMRNSRFWAGLGVGFGIQTFLFLLVFAVWAAYVDDNLRGLAIELGLTAATLAAAAALWGTLTRADLAAAVPGPRALRFGLLLAGVAILVRLYAVGVARGPNASFWGVLESFAIPTMMLVALVVAALVPTRRGLTLGAVGATAATTLVTHVADMGENNARASTVVAALAMAVVVVVALRFGVRAAHLEPTSDIGLRQLACLVPAAAALAVAPFLGQGNGYGHSLWSNSPWQVVRPEVAAAMVLLAAIALRRSAARRSLWLGVAAGIGAQAMLFFTPAFAIPLSNGTVAFGRGLVGITGGAIALITAVVILRRQWHTEDAALPVAAAAPA